MPIDERVIEDCSVATTILDWTNHQINLTDHKGFYLRRVSVTNSTSNAFGDRTSVGGIFLLRKGYGVATVNDTLMDNNLFGANEGLVWEGSVYITDVMTLWTRYVPYAVGDKVQIRVVISSESGANYAMPKPRDRLIQVYSSTSSGAGGNVTATITCPVGRRWHLYTATMTINEAAKREYLRIQSGSGVIHELLNLASSNGNYHTYPPGYTVTSGWVIDNSSCNDTYILERNYLRATVESASASKSLILNYTIIEEPDDQIPAPT